MTQATITIEQMQALYRRAAKAGHAVEPIERTYDTDYAFNFDHSQAVFTVREALVELHVWFWDGYDMVLTHAARATRQPTL